MNTDTTTEVSRDQWSKCVAAVGRVGIKNGVISDSHINLLRLLSDLMPSIPEHREIIAAIYKSLGGKKETAGDYQAVPSQGHGFGFVGDSAGGPGAPLPGQPSLPGLGGIDYPSALGSPDEWGRLIGDRRWSRG